MLFTTHQVLHLQHGEHKLRSTIAILKADAQRAHLELCGLRDDFASSIQAKKDAERRMEEYRQKHVARNVQADIKAESVRWRKKIQAETNILRVELEQQRQASMLKDQQLKKSREEVTMLRRQLQQQQAETKALRTELGAQKKYLKESKNRASMLLTQRTRMSIAEISSLLRSVQAVKIHVSSVQNQCANLAEHVKRTDAAVASLTDRDMTDIKARQQRIGDAFTTIGTANAHDRFQLVEDKGDPAGDFGTRDPAEAQRHALELHGLHLDTNTAQMNHIPPDIDDTKALRKVADELYMNLQEMTKNNY